MIIKTQGVILSQRSYRDNEKYLTILTKDCGLIEARIRVFGQIKRTIFQSICPPGYYKMDLFVSKQMYYTVDTIEKIEDFFTLRYDVEKLALAGYFCELTQALVPAKEHVWVYLRLLLNTLYLLEQEKRIPLFLKAVFELRSLSISGFMPNLVCCRECCEYEQKQMYFLPLEGELICSDCMREHPAQRNDLPILLNKPVLSAMRYIIYKDFDKLFDFSLSPVYLKQLSQVTEYYMLTRLEKEFNSLVMYKQLKTEEP